MFYIRKNFLCCILIMFLLPSVYSQRDLDLREKLERLLEDPEYSDFNNEIPKPRQIHGMLLKDLREHGLFETSSEERLFEKFKNFEKTLANSERSEEEKSSHSSTTMTTIPIAPTTSTLTTTTLTPNDEEPVTSTTASVQKPKRVENLGSIISRFIDMLRNY